MQCIGDAAQCLGRRRRFVVHDLPSSPTRVSERMVNAHESPVLMFAIVMFLAIWTCHLEHVIMHNATVHTRVHVDTFRVHSVTKNLSNSTQMQRLQYKLGCATHLSSRRECNDRDPISCLS